MIIISSTLIGLNHSKRIKAQISICDELYNFSNKLLLDIKYSQTPALELIKNANLEYVGQDMIKHKARANTQLSKTENDKIGEFIYNLGKYDTVNQISQIEGFREYIKALKDKYERNYISKSKVYLSLGISFGLILSLMII